MSNQMTLVEQSGQSTMAKRRRLQNLVKKESNLTMHRACEEGVGVSLESVFTPPATRDLASDQIVNQRRPSFVDKVRSACLPMPTAWCKHLEESCWFSDFLFCKPFDLPRVPGQPSLAQSMRRAHPCVFELRERNPKQRLRRLAISLY